MPIFTSTQTCPTWKWWWTHIAHSHVMVQGHVVGSFTNAAMLRVHHSRLWTGGDDNWQLLTLIFTINISPKSMENHHHMWTFMFKFHLVPLVLVELFVCKKMAKIGQNGDKHGHMDQVDMTRGWGPKGRHRPAPPGATSRPCHVSDPWEHVLDQWQA
jgi:hypothetical protein